VDVKATVIFRNDEQGLKNLEIAYKTIAYILAKYIKLDQEEKNEVERKEVT